LEFFIIGSFFVHCHLGRVSGRDLDMLQAGGMDARGRSETMNCAEVYKTGRE